MPGFDGTGPMGQGPLTGRGLGYCNSTYPVNQGWFGRGRAFIGRWFGGAGYGRGFGRRFMGPGRGLGYGRGRGWRFW